MASPDNVAILSLIDSCLKRLPGIDKPSKRDVELLLSDACPALSLQLDNPQLAALDPPLDDETTIGQLLDVKHSLLSRQAHPSAGHAPQTDSVQQVLKEIYQPEKIKKSVEDPVEKMLDWLGQKLREYFKHDNWLTRNFNFDKQVSENVIKGMTNALVVILAVVVLYIIVNELRAASILKLFRRRSGVHRRLREQTAQTHGEAPANIKAISELPLNRQVPALLRYTLQYLIDKQVLPRRYNLTNQEFLAIVRDRLPAATHDFKLLVDSGDRALYGNKPIAASETTKLFEHVKNIEQIPHKAAP